jgi:hypothetical protein
VCFLKEFISNNQGETAGAILWRRCAFHSGEISAKDNEILYFLIFQGETAGAILWQRCAFHSGAKRIRSDNHKKERPVYNDAVPLLAGS